MLGSQLPALAGRLKQFAQDAGLAGANVRYIVREREMVPANAGVKLRDLVRGSPATIDLPFAARRIWLKNNLRIEGIERLPGTTAKLQIHARGSSPSVMRDVRARAISRRLIVDPMVGIPKIHARDMRAGSWYIEDFVDGRVSERADLVEFVTNRGGAALWLPTARLRPIKRPFHRGLIEALEQSLASLFPPVPEDALWPVSFSHNDLKLDNLLRDAGGKFWLIDWEGAGVVPLVSDLGSAYLDVPDLADTIFAILAAADPAGRALSPRHQLALGAALALQRRANGAAVEAKWRGLSDHEAARRHRATLNLYRNSIVRLAG